jgi:hypothetical protein
MAGGITTHIARVPADAGLSARQHEAYADAVARAGWAGREVSPADDLAVLTDLRRNLGRSSGAVISVGGGNAGLQHPGARPPARGLGRSQVRTVR